MFASYIAIREIEIAPCQYETVCSARGCSSPATLIARAFDNGGRPVKQYELCLSHSVYIAQREKRRGRSVVYLLDALRVPHDSGRAMQQLAIF